MQPSDVTPMSALLWVAVGVLFGLGWHLAGVLVGAIQAGAASTGAVICIVLAVVVVVVAIAV